MDPIGEMMGTEKQSSVRPDGDSALRTETSARVSEAASSAVPVSLWSETTERRALARDGLLRDCHLRPAIRFCPAGPLFLISSFIFRR